MSRQMFYCIQYTLVTHHPPAPPTPTEVTAQFMNASSVRVTWQWTSSDPAPSCFNTTRVKYHPEGGRESSLQLRDPAATDIILTGLQSNTRYTITVVATAGEHRGESVAMTVLLPLVLQGMTIIIVYTQMNPEILLYSGVNGSVQGKVLPACVYAH